MNIDYRILRGRDASRIAEFLQSVGGDTDFLPFSASDVSATEEIYFSGLLLCGAIADGQIAAIAEVLAPSLPRMHHAGTLFLAAGKKYWGTGIAQHLFEFAKEEAREKGVRKLQLSIADDNHRAKAFVLRNGFTSEGRDVRMLAVDGKFIDGERYYLLLD